MSNGQQRRRAYLQLAHDLRGTFEGRSRLSVFREAALQGLMPAWRDQADLAAMTGIDDSVDPAVVADFLLAFTDGQTGQHVLDPWAGIGVTLAALEGAGRIDSGIAVEINQDVYELIMALRSYSQIEWLLADASRVLADGIGTFDLIVGSPPLGLPNAVLETQTPRIKLTASQTYTMLVQAALTLRPEGTLAVVLPESFFAYRQAPVREALRAASIYPSAALALPLRFFATYQPLSLVVMTHTRHEDLFTAELDPSSDFAAVVANIRARRNGRLPQLGHLVPDGEFVSWRATMLQLEIAAAARTMGLQPVPFNDFCVAMHGPRRTGDPFDDHPGAVYLPKLGTAPAVASIEDLQIKPQNHIQLIVRPDVVDPQFLAAFLSSALGRKLREQLASGVFIPQISLSNLRKASAPLPPRIEHQQRAVQVSQTLTELQRSVAGLERRLWEQPLRPKVIETELRALLEGDGTDRWIESLPFPLASILWRHQVAEDAQQRSEYLVHFFEATTIFLVDILHSALQRDPSVIAEVGRRPGAVGTYLRGSIGIWGDLLARLAKRTRDLVSKDRALARELFGVETAERLDAIASKALVLSLKDEAADYRRNWIGHAAVVGKPEWDRRLIQAESTLARIRLGMDDAFVGWELVRAGRGANRGGVITTSIERLVGSRSLFRKGTAMLREWPEDGQLYMLEEGGSLPLRIGPLFMLKRSPESVEDVCYFYDRIQEGGVRWVSYHYEPLPELVRPEPDVVHLIEELNALG